VTGSARSGADRAPPLLLYDGLCGFCDATVRFVLRRDPHGTMRFAPLQGPTAQAILERHPHLRGIDSLVLVEAVSGVEAVSVRSEAARRVAAYLGGGWGVIASALHRVPLPLRDAAYDLFARHRHRLFGRRDACEVPGPEVRARFLP